MMLTNICLTNFGTFQGQQEMSLRPRSGRPIVLFGGKNGSGKTTLLEAIRLGFYGQLWSGARTSREQYLAYLDSRIHRNPNLIIQPNHSSISLEFEFADTDGLHVYRITRSWERGGNGRIAEALEVQRDGHPLDEVAEDHWQDFIRDLVPNGVAQLFFFDGEKIQQLAEDTSDQRTLADSIKLLLGVDLVERLDADLAIYLSRSINQRQRGEDTNRISALEAEIHNERSCLNELNGRREQQLSELSTLKDAADLLEQKLSASGGSFARNREGLLKEQQRTRAEMAELRHGLRDLCTGLLPFALAPELCGRLKKTLLREESQETAIAAGRFTRKLRSTFKKKILAGKLGSLKETSPRVRKALSEELDAVIEKLAPANKVPIVHGCSPAERRQLLRWIESSLTDIPHAVQVKTRQLEQLVRREHRIESHLKRVPAEEALKSLLNDLQEFYKRLAERNQEIISTNETIRATENKVHELMRRYESESRAIVLSAEQESRIQLVPKIRSVLDEFKETLISQKVLRLEGEVTNCFNVLCRKKDAMRRISIDPTSFGVTIRDKDGQPIPKAQLSAGEKQVYAISMLWALAKTSGRPLPVVIDTPMARLDRDHRQLLGQHYFPNASHQVIILSTDTEVDEAYFEQLAPSVSRAYLLDFSAEERCTTATAGYFWRHQHESLEAAAQ